MRFAISNQMPKGKKVAVFSTKSNITTKENIANVFGAKTLLALVKLDLHLEMEPSKGSSTQNARNWATPATDRSMEVHVQGHISKPVFGEGRQAPDRQMFFVNSRPCTLPQVAKAFNEVYRSFNVSQSPFVFANLIMDTNAYDVNVSPDKRIIMLHDQAALLESLKAALTGLFEQTDHTVPQSQLPNRKLASYKPLTVQRRTSTEDKTPMANEESEDGPRSGDEECERVSAFSLRANRNVNGTAPSLIENWIGRDTERRSETPRPKKGDATLSKDKQKLVNAMKPTGPAEAADYQIMEVAAEPSTTHHRDDASIENVPDGMDVAGHASTINDKTALNPACRQDAMSTPYDAPFSQRPPCLPRPVQDFNALMDRTRNALATSQSPDEQPVADAEEQINVESPPEIPAIAPSLQKATPGAVQNAFDRMRPKRTPLQTAEITIGDQTTMTVIGSSPPYKRRKVHQPVHSQAIRQFGGSPPLARGLRSFAAPGSQLEMHSSAVGSFRRRAAEHSDEESEDGLEAGRDTANELSAVASAAGTDHNAQTVMNSDVANSDPLDALLPAPADDDEVDGKYVDEHEKKLGEDEKVARLIQEAEIPALLPTEYNLRRASRVLKNGGNRRESTLQLARDVNTSADKIMRYLAALKSGLDACGSNKAHSRQEQYAVVKDELDDSNAESPSLTHCQQGRLRADDNYRAVQSRLCPRCTAGVE